jgi:drug/metabolite transporter (DMT)-like permease
MNTEARISAIARWHVTFGLVFAVLGMALGIYMSMSKNHGQHVTHAHALLLGFVVSVIYAAIYHLWLKSTSSRLATIQTALHQVGTLLVVIGLLLLFGGRASEDALGPLLGGGSLAVISSAALMLYLFTRGARRQASQLGEVAGVSQS